MLFHYRYSRHQTARNLVINMLILPGYYWLVHYLTAGQPQYENLLQILLYVLVALELAFAAITAWLLTHPAVFEIRVSEQEFTLIHPLFSHWNFSVNPQDILRIEQTITGIDFRRVVRQLVLHDGRTFEICPNYPYSRKALYAALKQANPAIELPSNPHYFKTKR